MVFRNELDSRSVAASPLDGTVKSLPVGIVDVVDRAEEGVLYGCSVGPLGYAEGWNCVGVVVVCSVIRVGRSVAKMEFCLSFVCVLCLRGVLVDVFGYVWKLSLVERVGKNNNKSGASHLFLFTASRYLMLSRQIVFRICTSSSLPIDDDVLVGDTYVRAAGCSMYTGNGEGQTPLGLRL